MKFKQFLAVAAATVLFAVTGYLGVQSASSLSAAAMNVESVGGLSNLFSTDTSFTFPSEPFLAEIDVVGEIAPSGSSSPYSVSDSGGYDHTLYMNLIDALMDDPDNRGILLYVNSPGGTVYESDELYLKLMEYRAATERPVYAYFTAEACSGGYYISMAANEIYANRNAWTGSIGVIMSLLNYQGLSEKIGVTAVDITAGRNKAMGSGWETLTDEQRDILQSLVDESYEQFIGIVAAGRNLDLSRVRELADGRIYSAQQALDRGLIDHIAGEEEAISAILEKCGLDDDSEIYVPERFDAFSVMDFLMSRASAVKPKSELELFREMLSDYRNGAILYHA